MFCSPPARPYRDPERYTIRKLFGYLNNAFPVVRVRKSGDEYYITYKSGGVLAHEEYNLPLTKDSYEHLLSKADGIIITKKRYLIPYNRYTIELDVFEGAYKGLYFAEVEFESEEEALSFEPPHWFTEDVTYDRKYHNSYMATVLINSEPTA